MDEFGMHLHHDDRYGDELLVEPQAWTSPRTYTAAEIITSTIMNTDHRDNLRALSQACIVSRTPASVGGYVVWDTFNMNTGGFTLVGGNSGVVVPASGYYRCDGYSYWSGPTGTGEHNCRIERWDAGLTTALEWFGGHGSQYDGGFSALLDTSCGGLVQCTAGQVIRFWDQIGATGAGGNTSPRMSVQFAGGG